MQLAWHGGKGVLACVTEDSTVVLNESVMHAYMSGELSVVQVSSQEVSLHIAGSLDPIVVSTSRVILMKSINVVHEKCKLKLNNVHSMQGADNQILFCTYICE